MLTLEEILNSDCLEEAKQEIARKRKGNQSGDGVTAVWVKNRDQILESIRAGSYEPQVVVQKEIVSAKGKRRTISVMQLQDQVVAKAISIALNRHMDDLFSDRCFAYRPGRGTKAAAAFAADRMNEQMVWAAGLDLKDFFDSVRLDRLTVLLRRYISDQATRQLISSFLTCRIRTGKKTYRLTEGILQGSPLSPFLSNLYFIDYDKDFERFPGYCRYADDIRIFARSETEAKEASDDVRKRLTEDGLRLNLHKCSIFRAAERPVFGYELSLSEGRYQIHRIRKPDHVHKEWSRTELREPERTYEILKSGVLTKQDYAAIFENEEGKWELPPESIDAISVYSDVTFTSGFFRLMSQNQIIVHMIDHKGETIGTFIPQKTHSSFQVICAQIGIQNDGLKHLELARNYQYSNIFNIRAALRYYERRSKSREFKTTIDKITGILKEIDSVNDVTGLLIREARARQLYYDCFNSIMKDNDFTFVKRTRRPPKDAVNAMISFGNTLLYHRFADYIYHLGLDIRLGIIHSSFKRPENLNLDFADLFKPIVTDRVIFTLVNRHMLDEHDDFEPHDDGVFMTYHAKRVFLEAFYRKINQYVSTKSGRKTYQQLMRQEVVNYKNYVLGNKEYKPFRYIN